MHLSMTEKSRRWPRVGQLSYVDPNLNQQLHHAKSTSLLDFAERYNRLPLKSALNCTYLAACHVYVNLPSYSLVYRT